MPKKQVTDPITDQEIAFARLVLSGNMTDRRAAEVAGLNPDTAAYTKSKPRVRAYMLEHRAAVNEQLVDQDADLSRQTAQRAADQQRRLEQARDRILARLWEIADLDSEKTRGNMSSQVKAISLIATIEGVIPDGRTVSAQKKPAHPPVTADIYRAAWLRNHQQDADSPPAPIGQQAAPEPSSAPGSAGPTHPVSPTVDLTDFPGHSSPAETASLAPRVPGADFVPPSRIPRSLSMYAWKLRR
jgi:hypothetical protein